MNKFNLPIKLQIPDSFYEEEVRCDYLVKQKDKMLWAIDLDLLNEFATVCNKYNLRWYIAYGSLLGVIRHKGFIPWDNDLDVTMPRKDFNKLCEVAEKEFQHPYFWQTPQTEGGKFFVNIGRLCNSLTTGRYKEMYDWGCNCGLYIDVNILDNMPTNRFSRKFLRGKIKYYSHFERFLHPFSPKLSLDVKNISALVKYALWKTVYTDWDGTKLFQKINQICTSYNNKYNKLIGSFSSPYGEKEIVESKYWKDIIWMDFEMMKVPVPAGYDTILKTLYNDYMQFPPLDKRATHELFDMEPRIPFNDFYKKNESK